MQGDAEINNVQKTIDPKADKHIVFPCIIMLSEIEMPVPSFPVYSVLSFHRECVYILEFQ